MMSKENTLKDAKTPVERAVIARYQQLDSAWEIASAAMHKAALEGNTRTFAEGKRIADECEAEMRKMEARHGKRR